MCLQLKPKRRELQAKTHVSPPGHHIIIIIIIVFITAKWQHNANKIHTYTAQGVYNSIGYRVPAWYWSYPSFMVDDMQYVSLW